jgi:hypothetical protein
LCQDDSQLQAMLVLVGQAKPHTPSGDHDVRCHLCDDSIVAFELRVYRSAPTWRLTTTIALDDGVPSSYTGVTCANDVAWLDVDGSAAVVYRPDGRLAAYPLDTDDDNVNAQQVELFVPIVAAAGSALKTLSIGATKTFLLIDRCAFCVLRPFVQTI